MKILAGIRPAHGHDDQIAVLKQQFVAHRRFQQVAILVDPQFEIERRDLHGPIIPAL
jgi:hypothetical protein